MQKLGDATEQRTMMMAFSQPFSGLWENNKRMLVCTWVRKHGNSQYQPKVADSEESEDD